MVHSSIVFGSLSLASLYSHVAAWPGMAKQSSTHIGPSCTVNAHGWFPDEGACPNMAQPPAPNGSLPVTADHVLPDSFTMEWLMYFVPNASDVPPYFPYPTTPYNVTSGRTYYQIIDSEKGIRNMKEVYDSYCIPVFGDPLNPMGRDNNWSCDFLNVGETNTSYVVLHEDKPLGAPDCCIIGRPFHPPPPDFHQNMPTRWNEPNVGGVSVDWGAVYDVDAGIFNYGFNAETGKPFSFYMQGVPWVAQWLWQPFTSIASGNPSEDVWKIPSACDTAKACPGWRRT